MADQGLKSISPKILRKIIREGKLSALISSEKGEDFFTSYLGDKPHFNKYWIFYKSASEIVANFENKEQHLCLIKQCFEKHIAIGADSDERIDECVSTRSAVENLSKAISEGDTEKLQETFKGLQESAFEYLHQQAFLPLVPEFVKEYNSRSNKGSCELI